MPHKVIKLCLVGNAGVGKSSLLYNFLGSKFKKGRPPTAGAEFSARTIELDGEQFTLDLWDIAGQDGLSSAAAAFLNACTVVLFVFDLTRRDTMDGLRNWIRTVRQCVPSGITMIVGNKADSEDRKVSAADAQAFAETEGRRYMETSATIPGCINSTIMMLAEEARQYIRACHERDELLPQELSASRHPSRANEIHDAIRTGDLQAVQRCIDLGQVNQRNAAGLTPLMTAGYYCRKDLIPILVEAGAVVNAVDHVSGDTAAHYAALSACGPQKQCGTVMLLGDLGADMSIQNFDGYTAGELASRLGNHQFAEAAKAL